MVRDTNDGARNVAAEDIPVRRTSVGDLGSRGSSEIPEALVRRMATATLVAFSETSSSARQADLNDYRA